MSPPAGYSGTPLHKKLGLKPDFRVAFVDLPADVRAELKDALAQTRSVKSGAFDFCMVFTRNAAALKKEFPRLARQLAPRELVEAREWDGPAVGALAICNK